MIAASDPQEFVPSGRQQTLKHPGPRYPSQKCSNDDILQKFEQVSLKERKESEWWILRKAPVKQLAQTWSRAQNDSKNQMDFLEDELYVRGNTAVWSRGLDGENLDNGKKTLCCYTSNLPVKHALWCNFYCEHPDYGSDLFNTRDKLDDNETEAVCIVDEHNVHIYTKKGEDFVTALPFQIGQVWSTKYGLLLEKEINQNTSFLENKATLYSLAFPLDDVCPVGININSHVQIMNNSNFKVVFTHEQPSICLIYNTQTRQHSVYKIRKVTTNEKMEFAQKMNSTYPTASLSQKFKNPLSIWEQDKNSLILPSSRPSSVASFYHQLQHSRPGSPMVSRSYQSPAPSSLGSPWLLRASRLNTSLPNALNSALPTCSFFDSSKPMSYLHTNPVICLDHLWTDPNLTQDDNTSTAASKVFLCDDFNDQWYLCYVLPVRCELNLVQVDFLEESNISFGLMSSISAKDAVPIPSLHMMAILEQNENVTLYSGTTPVGKLHIGGTLVKHTPSPYVRRNLTKFSTPFPRRSSLLPHCKPTDPKFDEHLLSPVLPETTPSRTSNVLQLNFQLETNNVHKAVLNGLRDPIENRITLRYTDGTYYRLNLPPLTAHSLIQDCINTLKQCLTKDLVFLIMSKWYSTRNAFGTQDLSLEQEWKMFEGLLLELIGYEQQDVDCPATPLSNPKKLKHSSSGNDDDWLFLSKSNHDLNGGYFRSKLQIPNDGKHNLLFDKTLNSSILFKHINLIHYCLHLLYEDMKLNSLKSEDLKLLGIFLNRLSSDLGLEAYSLYYWKDFPENCTVSLKQTSCDKPPNIMEFIYNVMLGKEDSYPYIENVNNRSKDIIQICGLILQAKTSLVKQFKPNVSVNGYSLLKPEADEAILMMTSKKITVRDLDTLPPALYLLIYGALWKCRQNPSPDLPVEAFYLLWRDDLASHNQEKKSQSIFNNNNTQIPRVVPFFKAGEQDGMECVDNPLTKLRFPDDVRVQEARKMLQSSRPVSVVLQQRPDVSDHDFIEEQEKHLYAICTRTMALSPGRGMFTLRTSQPVITEPLQAPALCLTGKAPPRGTTVELNHIDTPSNMNLWPLFHNGVSSGLRITPDASNIDNTWIRFNKPKNYLEQQLEHAGFLMALGLNGHLKNLDVLNTYDYLIKLNEMTSIGILLGLSAAFRGTADLNMTKTLSIHVEALLPPTSMEMDVHQNVQVAALLGIGLVYQGTSNRHIIEVLLSEIGRPPGPEMENSVDRESYSLAAGLALGLVTLKQGSCSLGLSDLNISDQLYYYMVGGKRRPFLGAQQDKYRVSSFQIREGTSVNLDVTAPGATLALGLMYLGTGNKAIADWMAPPETQYLLDFVRPDFLMFRILARSLILWDDIEPTKEWVESQVPSTIRPYCMIQPIPNSDIDYEVVNQAYCNIVTGACFALGLKFAGSADEDAFETLLHFCHMFTNLTIKSIAELAGKPTLETCLNVLLLSTSMVMAGTGNLEIMRLVRLLRRRVGVASSSVVTYGSHLALHMALGLLFLGGGRYTLSNSPGNIAALLCAFYPKFPTHSNDNRYHLQAFRHLYVLAVESRLIIPKDVHTGKLCYANLSIVKLDGTVLGIKGPGIVPDLETLHKVEVCDERYWSVVFQRGHNWDILVKLLSTHGCIEVKKRAGCLSYAVDKLGYHSQLAKTLTQSETVPWDPPASSIVSFTHDKAVKHFCEHFLTNEHHLNEKQLKMKQLLTRITYEAVIKDKLIIIPVISFLIKVLQDVPSAVNLWQLKLIFGQVLNTQFSTNLLSSEVVLAVQQQIVDILESWEGELMKDLQCYVKGEVNDGNLRKLAMYVVFFDIPYKENGSVLEMLMKNQDFAPQTVEKLTRICLR